MQYSRDELIYLLSDPDTPDRTSAPGAFPEPIPAEVFRAMMREKRRKEPSPGPTEGVRLDPDAIIETLERG